MPQVSRFHPHTNRPIDRGEIDGAARKLGRRPALQSSRNKAAIRRKRNRAVCPADVILWGALASLQVRDMCARALARATFPPEIIWSWDGFVLDSSEGVSPDDMASAGGIVPAFGQCYRYRALQETAS